MDVKPTRKTIAYPHLTAEIDYEKREMTLIVNDTGECLKITSPCYPELHAIMADIGLQAAGTQTTQRR